MRILNSLVAILLFILALGFAVKNTVPVTLHFFLGRELSAPLSLLVFAFLILGMILGVSAALVVLYRQRREIALLKRELASVAPPDSED